MSWGQGSGRASLRYWAGTEGQVAALTTYNGAIDEAPMWARALTGTVSGLVLAHRAVLAIDLAEHYKMSIFPFLG